jgi:hypothetical protein
MRRVLCWSGAFRLPDAPSCPFGSPSLQSEGRNATGEPDGRRPLEEKDYLPFMETQS